MLRIRLNQTQIWINPATESAASLYELKKIIMRVATTVTLNNGVPIESVVKMMGHTNIKTTHIYAKVMDHKISEDMQLLKHKLLSI